MAKYTACICEGGAERAVLDLLLDNHMLIFEREQLIEEEVLRCRSAKEFEEKHFKVEECKKLLFCSGILF